jgi:hypothetical protein
VARSRSIDYPVLAVDEERDPGLLARRGNRSGVTPFTAVIARDSRITYVHRDIGDDDLFQRFVLPLPRSASRA